MTYHLFLPKLDQKATPLFHCSIWVYSMYGSISRSGDFSWRSTTATGCKPGRDCILMAFTAGWDSESSTDKRHRNCFVSLSEACILFIETCFSIPIPIRFNQFGYVSALLKHPWPCHSLVIWPTLPKTCS